MRVIHSNGSKWAGEELDPIEALLERLASTPLHPSFEHYGNFFEPARKALARWDEHSGTTRKRQRRFASSAISGGCRRCSTSTRMSPNLLSA
jgi:hypothetical protein